MKTINEFFKDKNELLLVIHMLLRKFKIKICERLFERT